MRKQYNKKEWWKFFIVTGATIIVITASIVPAFAMTNITNQDNLINIQGTQTLSQLYYTIDGDITEQFVIPLSPTYLTYESYDVAGWQSNFYYADFIVNTNSKQEVTPLANNPYIPYYPRVEVKQENYNDNSIEEKTIQMAQWGQSPRYTGIDTTFYSKDEEYVLWLSGYQNVDEHNIPYDVTNIPSESWTTLRYEIKNMYHWSEDQFENHLNSDSYQNIITLLKIGAYYLGDNNQEKSPIQIRNQYVKVYNLANPSETKELQGNIMNIAYSSEDYWYIFTKEWDFAKEGEIWVIDTMRADISIRLKGSSGQPKIYIETKYNIIEPLEKIRYAVTHNNKIELPSTVDMGSWLATSIGSFMGMEIAPGVSIGGILGVFVAFGTTMWLMKVFLGG